MTPRIQADIDRLRQDFSDLTVTEPGDGTVHVRIPDLHLPNWWNPTVTRVLLVVQPDFPNSRPAFYVAHETHNAAGSQPRGANGPHAIDGEQWMGLCWNWNWDPGRETLWRLVKAVQRRFDEHD